MIQEKKLVEIGKILKSHGVKGEMTFLFNQREFAETDNNYYFFLLDGLFVPFFVEEFRLISNVSACVKIEGINTVEEAISYSDTLLYLPKELIGELDKGKKLESEWEQFIGYTIFDDNNVMIGVIKSVDFSTINVLFIVSNKDGDILIPATTDFILEVNQTGKQLYLSLPEGLLDDAN